jgi:molecular chaperone HtpG
MVEEQTAIYYILSGDIETVVHSPHLDNFRARDVEVLYLLDPLDGFLVQALTEYEGKPFQSVDDAGLELPDEPAPATAAPEVPQAEFDRLSQRFKTVLGERVTEVRASKLLSESPCRLVSPEAGAEVNLQRIRRLLGEEFELQPRILELNRTHPLIQNLSQLVGDQPEATLIDQAIEQLYENLLLLEGLHPNPAQMVPRIQTLLEAATGKLDEP